jgi:transcriptional regulator with XRE-family HTH domain
MSHERVDKKAFGARIREWKDKRGWTNADLAEAVKMDDKAVGKILQGQRFPYSENLGLFAEAFGKTVEELLEGLPPPGASDSSDEPIAPEVTEPRPAAAPPLAAGTYVQNNIGTVEHGGVVIGVVHGSVTTSASAPRSSSRRT